MKIGLFGCGAYGLALNSVLEKNNEQIEMWTTFDEEKEEIENYKTNRKIFPEYKISNNVSITTDAKKCASGKDLIIISIPIEYIPALIEDIKDDINCDILVASKGIHKDNEMFVHQILEEYNLSNKMAIISGPTFAEDLINEKVEAITLATTNYETSKKVHKAFECDYLKIEDTEDILGVEICGAMKNIMALASGILEGMDASESTKAMFLTEACACIEEGLKLLGGKKETFTKYAGIGDLLLTCNSKKSRNNTYGKMIGSQEKPEKLIDYLNNNTVEGVYTLQSFYNLLKEKNISIPLVNAIYDIVIRNININILIEFLKNCEKDLI